MARVRVAALASLGGVVACSLGLPTAEEYAEPPPVGSEAGVDAERPDAESSASPPSDAASADASGSFVACGGNGIPGDVSTLYRSENGVVTVVDTCSRGCEWTKDAANDRCRSDANCVAGAGLYCGGNGVSGDEDVLFRCGGGRIVPEARCVGGCEKRPSGQADRCSN